MVTNLMELPTPVLSTEEDNKKASTCDYSNCEEMAVCYCIQCEQKICDTHQQVSYYSNLLCDVKLNMYILSPTEPR